MRLSRAVAATLLAVAALPAPGGAATWRHPWRGLAIERPAGWEVAERRVNGVLAPVTVLTATSFRLPAFAPGPEFCATRLGEEVRRLRGVALLLTEELDRAFLHRFPRRPAHFRFDPALTADSCAGHTVVFRDERRAFYLHAFTGPRPSRASLRRLERVASSLRVRPRPPLGRLRLTQPPQLGVACPVPNSIRCDRVGVAAWPAVRLRSLTVYVGRRAARLADVGPYWEAHVDGAGLGTRFLPVQADRRGRWYGDPPVYAWVRLRGVTAAGAAVQARVRVQLRPGWG